jgi:tRNA nucleotidyltransferase (CCA-adding enzyme)
MVLARYLYPEAVLVRSNLMTPSAKKLYRLFRDHLKMNTVSSLRNSDINKIIVVDTRSYQRLEEYFNEIGDYKGEIEIWDHHPPDNHTISNAKIYEKEIGANTSLLGLEIIERKIKISREDATIALAGIYADTGNFTYENVTPDDFIVASFLRESGASIPTIRQFLTRLSEEHQISLFNEVLNNLTDKTVNGYNIALSYTEFEKQKPGLSSIVEEINDIRHQPAIFCVFYSAKERNTQIIARSRKDNIAVNKILERYGGGGHNMAASANIKNSDGKFIFEDLISALKESIPPAIQAKDIMTKEIHIIRPDWSLKDASFFLEKIEHTGAPVIDENGELVGILTLRDIMKGRRGNQMHAPVKAYMATKLIKVDLHETVRNIRDIIFKKNIGHLPVMDNNKIAGIITRSDIIKFLDSEQKKEEITKENLNSSESGIV